MSNDRDPGWCPDGGAVPLREEVWGGTSEGRAAATVQALPGFSRRLQARSHLAETGPCGSLLGKCQTFI